MKPITSFTVTPADEWKSPPYLGNGFIGLRPGAQPLRPAKAVVGGYIRSQRQDSIEEHAKAPYPFTMDIVIHGKSLAESRKLADQQTLCMEKGELISDFEFEKCKITVNQSVSRSNPSLCMQSVTLTSEEDLEIQMIIHPEFSDVHGEFRRIEVFDRKKRKDELLYQGVTDRSSIGVCIGTKLKTDQNPGNEIEPADRCYYEFTLQGGQRACLQMLVSMVPSFYASDSHLEAKKQVSLGWMIGFENLQKRHLEAWASVWKARPVIEGNETIDLVQEAVDVAVYGLFSSCHERSMLGIPCFGWSQYANYSGHIFWDMDAWDSHPLLVMNPDVVKNLVLYRTDRMEAARRHAAMYGFDGIQYPWESGLQGEDVCPADADTSWGEHHIVPDVACMIWEYCQTTRDDDFVEKNAWPVLREVARWIVSRGKMTERGFEISDIVGVDEFSSCVKNNTHMNLVCRIALQAAIRCAERLGKKPDPEWAEVFERMFLAYNEEGALVPHESGFLQTRSDQHSPGSAHFVFLHGPEFYDALSMEDFEKTYHYDEKIRVHLKPTPSVPCSTESPGFTTPVFAAAAAFFGEAEKAARLFEQSYVCYAAPPFQNTKEYRKYEDGVYVTTYGAQLQAVIYGFCGLRVLPDPESWAAYPASLPEGWEKITIARAWIGGRPARIEAVNGEKAHITFLT